MRILYLNGDSVWTYGLPWGFRQLGHDVKIVSEVQRDYLRHCMEFFKPDLMVTAGGIDQYVPEKLGLIREAAEHFECLHVYWAVEDILHLTNWSLPLVKTVQPDAVLVKATAKRV